MLLEHQNHGLILVFQNFQAAGGHGGLSIFDLIRMVGIDATKFPFTIFGAPPSSGGVGSPADTGEAAAEMIEAISQLIAEKIVINFQNTTQLDGQNISQQISRIRSNKIGVGVWQPT